MTQQEFISKYAPYAIDTQDVFGVPASITLAQAILESGWGKSGLAAQANNFFGIKAGTKWNGLIYEAPTKEYINGQWTQIIGKFRKYSTAGDGFKDHATIYAVKKAKDLSKGSTDYNVWAQNLQKAGYATDPGYPNKLINLIKTYDLSQYDSGAVKKKL